MNQIIYYRLMNGNRVTGFERVITEFLPITGFERVITEFLPIAGNKWQFEPLNYVTRFKLSTKPVGIASLPRPRPCKREGPR